MNNDPVAKSIELGRRAMALSALKPVLLPECPTNKRATPNAFLRSALFSAIQSKDRIDMKGVVLASQSGISIEYTGEQLNQEDLVLWETLVHLAKSSPLGDVCSFTAYEILTAMNIDTGGSNHNVLEKGITRLIACALKISLDGVRAYSTSLIMSSATDKSTGGYLIHLDRSLIKLYAQSTWIDAEIRVRLRKKPLAQLLYGYYSSHKEPYPIKIETIYKLSGSKTNRISDFKKKVIIALEELVKIGFLECYVVEGEKVAVHRKKMTALESPR